MGLTRPLLISVLLEISVPQLLSIPLLVAVSISWVPVSVPVTRVLVDIAVCPLFVSALVVVGGGVVEEVSDVHGGEKRRGRGQGTRRFV